jgi:hypothetical protein
VCSVTSPVSKVKEAPKDSADPAIVTLEFASFEFGIVGKSLTMIVDACDFVFITLPSEDRSSARNLALDFDIFFSGGRLAS